MSRHCTLLFADVHADLAALEAILAVAGSPEFAQRFGSPDRIVNLGDAVQRGYSPCEVIDRLKGLEHLTSILGNHDEAFVWDRPVSGSDARSRAAHFFCRERGGWEGFFGGQGVCRLDREERLCLTHGGPCDPASICPPDAGEIERWLCSQSWQRIGWGERYLDGSGYHYLPEDAFAAVRSRLEPGFAILCGHEHEEAAFEERNGKVEDILAGLPRASFEAGGRQIEEKRIALEPGANYLVRLGLAGPEGYFSAYGWDRCYFGAYCRSDDERFIALLNFQLGRAPKEK